MGAFARDARNSMKVISGILRLICGLALIIFAFATYRRVGEHVAAGQPIQIAGVTIGASAGQLEFALIVFGVVGVLLIVLGVVTFVKKQ